MYDNHRHYTSCLSQTEIFPAYVGKASITTRQKLLQAMTAALLETVHVEQLPLQHISSVQTQQQWYSTQNVRTGQNLYAK